MKKLFLLGFALIIVTGIANAKITSKLSDGTILQFPDGTSNNVIQEVTNQVIKEKNKSGVSAVKESAPWEKDALVLTFSSKGEREYTPEELGLKPKEQKPNLPEGFRLEKQPKLESKREGTIWCKMFKVGCVTEEQKQKQAYYCEQRGNNSYQEGFAMALADPTVWQFAGKQSAQDYAAWRKRAMIENCLRMSSPQSF